MNMKKYILLYSGGGMPSTDEETKKVMAAWDGWSKKLGSKLVDMGFAFMPNQKGKMTDGKMVSESNMMPSGYSVIMADSMDDAVGMAKDCPVMMGGASVHVFEEMPIPGM